MAARVCDLQFVSEVGGEQPRTDLDLQVGSVRTALSRRTAGVQEWLGSVKGKTHTLELDTELSLVVRSRIRVRYQSPTRNSKLLLVTPQKPFSHEVLRILNLALTLSCFVLLLCYRQTAF